MSADSISIDTVRWWKISGPAEFRGDFLDSDLGSQTLISTNIRTLSTSGVEPGREIQGLLYVPRLTSEACTALEASQIPPNVTRKSDLPFTTNPATFPVVAIAPWLSAECVKEYLMATKDTRVRGFLFYLPNNDTSPPPIAKDATWGLGDGGDWKTTYNFPVYAIPGPAGRPLMSKSALYSGNMTQIPKGPQISQLFPNTTYVRLAATINTEARNTLPSLWVFLLVVLGVLLIVIGSTSLTMHWLQRRRRRDLRNRIINGEVDLEALGVRRLTVPREILEKMPLYTYYLATNSPNQRPPQNQDTADPSSNIPPGAATATAIADQNAISSTHAFSQPTCAICLDDFVSSESTVRELPCRHIFHPECIDTFLLNNSSLCPMCKNSILPKGYCPEVVTNAMVRRERMLRRLREFQAQENGESTENRREPEGFMRHFRTVTAPERTRARRMYGDAFADFLVGRRNQLQRPRNGNIEMNSAAPIVSTGDSQQDQPSGPLPASTSTAPSPPTNTLSAIQTEPNGDVCPPIDRREWAQQRAVAMLGTSPTEIAISQEEERERSKWWKRWTRKIWPNI